MTLHLDDRLLHGRILLGWAQRLDATRFILISERLADPALRQSYAAIAAAEGLEIACLAPGEFPARSGELAPDGFWLSDSAESALALWRSGLRFERLVLIGLREAEGEALGEDVAVGAGSRRALDELLAAGIRIECQRYPTADITPYRAAGGPASQGSRS